MLKGGVIGFGRMGITHLSILGGHPEVEFVSVCDSSDFILKNLKKQSSINIYTDYKKMIKESNLDFVIICTPTSSHASITKYAIQNNLHVFVEKPFTLSVNEGQEIVHMLNGNKLVNQVGYVNRFHEVFREVKKHLDDDLIGDLLYFKFEMYGPTVLRPTKASWRSKKKEGGGCLYDFASHSIDLINYLVGPPKKVAGSVLKKIYSESVEDAVYSTFIYDNGKTGQLMANWSDASYRKPLYKIELLVKKGKIIADQHAYKVFIMGDTDNNGFSPGWNIRYVTDFSESVRFYVRGNEFTRQLDYFIDCMLGKETNNISTFADALITDQIMENIVQDYEGRNQE